MMETPETNPYADLYKQALGTPVAAPTATTQKPSTMQTFGQGALDLGKGILKSGGQALSNIDEGVAKIPYIGKALTTPMIGSGTSESARQQLKETSVPQNTMQSIGKGVGDAAQFLIPGPLEANLAEKGYLGASKMLPVAKAALSGLTTGAVNKAQGGNFGTGAMMGAGGSILGEGAKAVAPKIAEKAIGITKADRGFSKNPGQAILNETTGIRPSTIGEQAQSKIGELTPQLQAEAHRSMQPTSLTPARNAVAGDIGRATQRNAGKTVGQMQPMSDFLERRFDTGAAIPSTVHPADLLDLRRGFNDEFGQWNPDTLPGVAGTARKGYGALTNEFHRAVPEAIPMDERISNLIPVAKRAESTSRGESVIPKMLGHGGSATLGGLYGYHESGRAGGALTGALIGAAAPTLLTTPEGRMIAARGLVSPVGRTAGKLLQGSALQLNRGDR